MKRGEHDNCFTCAHANTSPLDEPCEECWRIKDQGGEPFTKWEAKK